MSLIENGLDNAIKKGQAITNGIRIMGGPKGNDHAPFAVHRAWSNTCNREGGVCTLDWPFDPKTGLLKDFDFEQLKRVARAVGTGEKSASGRP